MTLIRFSRQTGETTFPSLKPLGSVIRKGNIILHKFSEKRWYRPIYCEGWLEKDPVDASRGGSAKSRSAATRRSAGQPGKSDIKPLSSIPAPDQNKNILSSRGVKKGWSAKDDLKTATKHSDQDSPNTTSPAESENSAGSKPDLERSQDKLPERVQKHDEVKESVFARGRPSVTQAKEPTFFIGGGNGVQLVEGPLLEMGWKRITEKYNDNFKLKWVESKSMISYGAFKEGEQLVNRIPNCSLLTNKLGLLNSLQRHDRINATIHKGRVMRMKSDDFLPETYRLDDQIDRKLFLNTFEKGETWICKPAGMNQGRGIYLVRDIEEFRKSMDERDEKIRKSKRPGVERIVQRYIKNPLLLDGRKFDVRAYMLIASSTPYLILYHKGYVRRCLHDYKEDETDLGIHLTNQYIQKKNAEYKANLEDTVWSMDKFNDYINENVAPDRGLEWDWVYNTFTNRMKQIIMFCFNAVKHKLKCRLGFFDLYGLDFMIDEDMKVWLIEINSNPSLATNCSALKEVIPGMIKETLYVALESFEKSRKKRALLPLKSLQQFQMLYHGPNIKSHLNSRSDFQNTLRSSPTGFLTERSRSLSPVQRARSLSPARDFNIQGQGQPTPVSQGQFKGSALKTQSHNSNQGQGQVKFQQRSLTVKIYTKSQTPTPRSSISPAMVGLWGGVHGMEQYSSTFSPGNTDSVKFRLTHAAEKHAQASNKGHLLLTPGRKPPWKSSVSPINSGGSAQSPKVSLTGVRFGDNSTVAKKDSQSNIPSGTISKDEQEKKDSIKLEPVSAKAEIPNIKQLSTPRKSGKNVSNLLKAHMATVMVTDLTSELQLSSDPYILSTNADKANDLPVADISSPVSVCTVEVDRKLSLRMPSPGSLIKPGKHSSRSRKKAHRGQHSKGRSHTPR